MQDILTAGYESLGADINKVSGNVTSETQEGIVSPLLPELTLNMDDEDIIQLFEKRKGIWDASNAKQEWIKQGDENEKYWLGKHFDDGFVSGKRPMVDNLIFECLETFLPQATRRNPDPMVSLGWGEEESSASDAYMAKVKKYLAILSDKNCVRRKLAKVARHWSIYLLGAVKYGWDLDKNIPTVRVVRPRKLILDPEATIDEDGYTGSFVGEIRKLEAGLILDVMKKNGGKKEATDFVREKIKNDTATEVQFIEWWTQQYMCWTLGSHVLIKMKNPHWKYDKTETPDVADINSPGVTVDDYGNASASPVEIKGINHFEVPKLPYDFLSVYNLGDQPMDKTSLIGQNLANQDLLNKKNRQITKNTDSMNGGMVVSLERSGLTETQARNVTQALRDGGTIVVPSGNPQEAIYRASAPPLPGDVFNQLIDMRSRMRDIFGTRGSTPAGVQSEQTVRGKILSRGLDTDRIGGGITEFLEQLADNMYNWMVQLLYVYDANFQFVTGAEPPKIEISIKEGSLLPKDSTTIANQAIELSTQGKMSTLDLYKRLEYSNPEELAANAWLEQNAPEILYQDNPMVMQAIQMKQQAAQLQQQAQSEAEMQKMDIQHLQGMQRDQGKMQAKSQLDQVKVGPGMS
jgi:hypothetical protein